MISGENCLPTNAVRPEPSESMIAALTRIWERVLGRAPIHAETNFFDLGGDFLLALRLLTEIEANSLAANCLQLGFQIRDHRQHGPRPGSNGY